MGKLMSIFRAAALIIAFALIAACTASPDTATPTPTPTPSPQEILNNSASQVALLDTLSFTLGHESGSILLMPGIIANELSGTVDIPDRYRMEIKGEATIFKAFLEITVIRTGDTTYMTDPLTSKWREISPDVIPVNLTDVGRTLSDIISAIKEPVSRGMEGGGDERTVHITGTILSDELSKLIPTAAEGLQVGLDVWVRESDSMLVRTRIDGQVAVSDSPDSVRILTLHGFNEPVTIEPPI